MGPPPSENTNAGLLERVRQEPIDQAAWETFVAYYGPKIRGWCRQRGLQAADVEDVTQDVLLRLARALTDVHLRPVPDLSRLAAAGDRTCGLGLLQRTENGGRCRQRQRSALAVLETAQAHDDLMALLARGVYPRVGEPGVCRVFGPGSSRRPGRRSS